MRFAMPKTVPPGLWRRVPPLIFVPLLGALGLVLAWRDAATIFALNTGLIEAAAGVLSLLTLFAVLTYAVKLGWRPSVLADELKILPGRAGVAAGVLCLYLLAGVLALYAPGLSPGLLLLAMALHVATLVVLLFVLRHGPAEQRRVSPVWHLSWAGFLVAAKAALAVGWPGVAAGLLWPSMLAAVAIWAISARQFALAAPPAPLRPLLAIHVAPFALIAMVAAGLDHDKIAVVSAMAGLLLLLALVMSARWLLASGFSPMWGALTFPLSASAAAWLTLAQGGLPGARIVAGVLLVAATLAIPPILFLILWDWARGRLAVKTNAAIA
ncbi:MAG: tellurium resistance protein [Paracoccus sp. (in: a-proteobacteria)]|uniref:SLAC1 family transporter n=1 Tax=Paracoccus sp. TaxID=267 RepID=UPI0026DF40EA|nr:tellurium resistance protein [Paracoccus sp. (in: a-proteobacteria)]MDO5632815.1 tellurium resistance protein [Paracoccus sp. (in: a-proteobacteria)]